MPIGAPPPPPSTKPTGGSAPPGVGWGSAPAASSQLCDKVTIAVTNKPQQFPAAVVTEDVTVKGYSTNAASLFVGLSQAAQPFEIEPSAALTFDPDNLQELWIKGTAGDTVAYFGK